MKNKKAIWGWALFDVANSSYTTIVITVAYTIIFSTMIVGAQPEGSGNFEYGNFLWSVLIATSNLCSALLAPIIGAITDNTPHRKRFLALSVGLCSITTGLLYFVNPGMIWIAGLLVLISNIGFNFSENFISSFLPHLVPRNEIGKVSGLAWGLGYFGGLAAIIICFLATGLVYQLENWHRLVWIGPITGLFFIVCSIPTFMWVPEPKKIHSYAENLGKSIVKGFSQLKETISQLRRYRDLGLFLLSFFFFQGGLTIVISFSALYGMQVVGIVGFWQMIFFLSLQISAALGAWIFGMLQTRLGTLKTLQLTLILWLANVIAIYNLNTLAAVLNLSDARILFLVLGNVAGLGLGATQSLARALVGLFSPLSQSGEFYGLWGLMGKLAAVMAALSFGLMQRHVPLRHAILLCSLFFLLGFIINLFVNEKRGQLAAA